AAADSLAHIDPGNQTAARVLGRIVLWRPPLPLADYARCLWPVAQDLLEPLATGRVPPAFDATLKMALAQFEQTRQRALYKRRSAAAILWYMGPGARPALPALRAALQDKDKEIRRWAAMALRKMGTKRRGRDPDCGSLTERTRQPSP